MAVTFSKNTVLKYGRSISKLSAQKGRHCYYYHYDYIIETPYIARAWLAFQLAYSKIKPTRFCLQVKPNPQLEKGISNFEEPTE